MRPYFMPVSSYQSPRETLGYTEADALASSRLAGLAAPAAATAAAPPALARLVRIVAFLGLVVAALRRRDRRRRRRLLARAALEQLEQQHGVFDHLAAAGQLGLRAALVGGDQLALGDQQIAQALAVAPGDVELDDQRVGELLHRVVQLG